MDFFEPSKKIQKGVWYVSPKFKICKSKDLMIRGRDFYAIWDEEKQKWSKDQDDAIRLIDRETKAFIQRHKDEDDAYIPLYMWDSDSGVIDKWNKYVQKQMKDNYVPLDNKIIFSNTVVKREDYSTHRLNYPLEEGKCDSYDKLMSTLYNPDERRKLEWAIGAIVSGDSVWIQKFIVIVGEPGTGKSTFFKILRMLFPGYLATINAKALGDGHSAFALEPLKNDPLVAIEDDADLSRITDNTRLNSLVSHEPMTVNEKYKSLYENVFHAFLFLGTNKDVKITDSASGLSRRLIDVVPSGNKLDVEDYNIIMKQIPFELGAIAYKCLQVYYHNKKKYNDYIPVRMLRATNLIYNFLEEYHDELFKQSDGCRFHDLWNHYNSYCELGKIQFRHDRQEFRNELRPYFKEYYQTYEYEPGKNCNGYFKGFKYEKLGLKNPFENNISPELKTESSVPDWLKLDCRKSIFDEIAKDYPAQLANENGTPKIKWANCTYKLSDIPTNELHYVKLPENHIVIDFDLKNDSGEKDKTANLEAAKLFPPTYAEWSKSGAGLHLHYIYDGDVKSLSRVYDDSIEIKIFTGDSSLRRQLNGCNNLNITTINSGLPIKEKVKMIDTQSLANEKALRTLIKRNLNKEYHNATAPSVQFIHKILNDAYENEELKYDVSDLKNSVLQFAANSTNQADKCLKLVSEMKWKSKNYEEPIYISESNGESPIIIYDVEVFINVFIVCWKYLGSETISKMVNPTPKDIEHLYSTGARFIGFNNRKYDAHIMYGRMMGYTNEQLYNQSQLIINNSPNAMFSEAYTIDYADIYDYSVKKQSLKKWEIELGLTHMENSYDWNEPLPDDKIEEVAEYCCNDVKATEAVFNKLTADFSVRELLSELSGLPVISTNRQHITKIIFGNEKKPNLIYTDLATGKQTYMDGSTAKPVNDYINSFPGYVFNQFGIDADEYENKSLITSGLSIYMGEDPSEGGFVYSEPGMYSNVVCFDVGGMHPASIIAMNKFGEYTKIYKEIRDARLCIKHKDYDTASKMLDGKISKFLSNKEDAKNLSNALKLILNSTYGFCSAKFDNPFRDPRDLDNIVAKRGALFMISLKNEVKKRGFKVIHCKTDSIKVVAPDKEISSFIFEFGRKYGYEFEIEHEFDRICLVNRAVYIGRYKDTEDVKNQWDATGAEFAHPYIFKTLFTHEKICFDDYCETKQATKGALCLDMNDGLEDVSYYENIKTLRNKFPNWKDGEIKTTKKNIEALKETAELSNETIDNLISNGHDYHFIGRIGRFIPVTSGGGDLVVKRDGKYVSAPGAKGYRWMEAETLKNLGMEHLIDKSYYRNLVDSAYASLNTFGPVEDFIDSPDGEFDLPF